MEKDPMRDALNPFIFAEKKGNAGPFIFRFRTMNKMIFPSTSESDTSSMVF
jgi:hypothetical protein